MIAAMIASYIHVVRLCMLKTSLLADELQSVLSTCDLVIDCDEALCKCYADQTLDANFIATHCAIIVALIVLLIFI